MRKYWLQAFSDLKTFIEYSNNMGDICQNLYKYNPDKKRKISIIFDEMIADMLSNKKLHSIVTEILIRGKEINISYVFVT